MLTCGVANKNRQVPVFVSDDGVLWYADPDGIASKLHTFGIIEFAVTTKRLAAGHAINAKAVKSDVTKLQQVQHDNRFIWVKCAHRVDSCVVCFNMWHSATVLLKDHSTHTQDADNQDNYSEQF